MITCLSGIKRNGCQQGIQSPWSIAPHIGSKQQQQTMTTTTNDNDTKQQQKQQQQQVIKG